MSSYITGPDVVKYACSCGLLKPITRLYFCRHCLELRCAFCVCHEVDSHYCGKCCENLPSAEARLKKNRCGDCYDCPSCKQTLSKRAATVGPKNPEDPKATPRKVYYLLCLNCRWSSRDVGIPDQAVATGSWPERENVHAARLQEIIEMYKGIVLAEKQQKLEKDKKKQRRFMTFTDRTGITASMLRKRIGLPDIPHPLLKPKPKEPEEAIAKEEVEQLPEELLTKTVNLNEITTIEQRLSLPEWQPTTVDKLFPVHKQVSVKRSLRCRSCEHNVSKPEYSPTSIKFKIQLFAFYHIPEIRIFTVEPLRAGKSCELLLKFSNPTQHQTVITFLPLYLPEEPSSEEKKENNVEANVAEGCTKEVVTEEKQPLSLTGSQPSSLLHTSLSRTPSITVKPRPIAQQITADVVLPTSTFVLLPRDDAAEFDDSGDTHNIQDDAQVVVWRKSNKAVIKLTITPSGDLNIGDEVVVGFTMQHIYVNTITAVDSKEPQRCNNNVKVFLYLGKVLGSD